MLVSGREQRQQQPDFGWQLNAVNWPLVFLSGLFLFTRIFLKILQRRDFWWDDHMLILSWVTLTVQSTLWAVMVDLGYGRDDTNVPLQDLEEMGVLLCVASTLLIFANIWSKTSFALTLLRLPLGWAKAVVWFIIVSMSLFLGTSGVFVWTQCYFPGQQVNPVSGLRCLPNQVIVRYSVFSGIYSALVDVSLAVLPWKFLWTLQMRTSEKIGVTFAMSMGIFAAVTAVIKTTLFPRLQDAVTVGFQVAAWGAVESAVSIMAASIPILRALIRQNHSAPMMDYTTGATGTYYLNTHSTASSSTITDQRSVARLPIRDGAPATLHNPADPERNTGAGDHGKDFVPRREKELSERTFLALDVKSNENEWDEPDRGGYEMMSYGAEVRPVDFTTK